MKEICKTTKITSPDGIRKRYIINCIRNNFGLEGTPVRLIIREKGEKEE